MDINDIYSSNSQWLKAEDIGNRSVIVKIESVQAVTPPGDNEKQKLEVSFAGSDKALLCNVTNARAIADLYGPDTDLWFGEELELFVMPVQGPNGPTKGIRVKRPAAARVAEAETPVAAPELATAANPFD